MNHNSELRLEASLAGAMLSVPMVLATMYILVLSGYELLTMDHMMFQWNDPDYYDYLEKFILFFGTIIVLGLFMLFIGGPLFSLCRDLPRLREGVGLSSEGIVLRGDRSNRTVRNWDDISSVKEKKSRCPSVRPVIVVSFSDNTDLIIPGTIKNYAGVLERLKESKG